MASSTVILSKRDAVSRIDVEQCIIFPHSSSFITPIRISAPCASLINLFIRETVRKINNGEYFSYSSTELYQHPAATMTQKEVQREREREREVPHRRIQP